MKVTASIAIKKKSATASKRLIGIAVTGFPARTFRTIGMKLTTNAAGKSNNAPIVKIAPKAFKRWPSASVVCPLKELLNGSILYISIKSRIASGIARIKPIIAAAFGYKRMFFIAF